MEKWVSENNPPKQIALSIGCTLVGLLLIYLCRDFGGSFDSNTFAGLLLGVLLLVIGVFAGVSTGKQTIIVDPDARRIVIRDNGLFGNKSRTILFREIAHVGIGFIGKKLSGVSFYFLLLKLHNGKEYSLFAPGRFYDGSSDRLTVEEWKERLEKYIGLHK